MNFFKKYIGDLFVTLRFYLLAGSCVIIFILSFFIPALFPFAKIIFTSFCLLMLIDYYFLFITGKKPEAQRAVSARLSNGDNNTIELNIKNTSTHKVNMRIIDELPFQFQERGFSIKKDFLPLQQLNFRYNVKPVARGTYHFGDIVLYVHSPLGLVVKRHTIPAEESVSVYPSFTNLRNHQLLSKATLDLPGRQRMRKVGQSMEFEQIKDYVNGDDIRTINWKATARKGTMMVNNYVDEKSQQVYCIIDKGRLMKMPFGGLSLLDYAINSALALSNVCLQNHDKIGLLSFSNKMGALIAAGRQPVQLENIIQVLYKEKTAFLESDFEMLYMQVRHKIKQRSLLILFTNFESVNGLKRQVSYLRSIARHHLLLVIFFENTKLKRLSVTDTDNIDDVYVKTIAGKFINEKKLVVKELHKYGILSILTSPENLTINTINKYLQLKAQQAV